MLAVVLPQTVPVKTAWQHITNDYADDPIKVLVPVQVFHLAALHQ